MPVTRRQAAAAAAAAAAAGGAKAGDSGDAVRERADRGEEEEEVVVVEGKEQDVVAGLDLAAAAGADYGEPHEPIQRLAVRFGVCLLLFHAGVRLGVGDAPLYGTPGMLGQTVLSFTYGFGIFFLLRAYRRWMTLGWAFFFWMMCILVGNLGNALAWYRQPKNLGPLPDLMHDVFPMSHIQTMEETVTYNLGKPMTGVMITDTLLMTFVAATVLFICLHKDRRHILRRVLVTHGSLMALRGLTVAITSLPDAHHKCRSLTPDGDLPNGSHSLAHILNPDSGMIPAIVVGQLQLLVPVGIVTCGDMVFSGHAILASLCTATFHTYLKWDPRFFSMPAAIKMVVWTYSMVVHVLVIASRLHYSLDVLLAMYLTITVFASLHRMAVDVAQGKRYLSVWLVDSLLIYPFVEWLETASETRPDPASSTSQAGLRRLSEYTAAELHEAASNTRWDCFSLFELQERNYSLPDPDPRPNTQFIDEALASVTERSRVFVQQVQELRNKARHRYGELVR